METGSDGRFYCAVLHRSSVGMVSKGELRWGLLAILAGALTLAWVYDERVWPSAFSGRNCDPNKFLLWYGPQKLIFELF